MVRGEGRKGAREERRSPVNFMRKNVFEIVKYNMKLLLEIQRLLNSEKKVQVLVAESCLTLCISWTVAHQALLCHGILQARILEWVTIPCCRGSCQPREWTQVSCTAGRFFTIWATWISLISQLALHAVKHTTRLWWPQEVPSVNIPVWVWEHAF